MEYHSIPLLLFTTLFLLVSECGALDTISTNKAIKDGETIVSHGEMYELGFFSPGKSKNRYLGIWYKKISTGTVVWVANRETPINDASGTLKVCRDGNLVILSGDNTVIWSSNSTVSASVGNNDFVAQLLDTGNLVVWDKNRNSTNKNLLWESFDYPGDTLLPGMKFGKDLVTGLQKSLTSWKSPDDPSCGLYNHILDTNGYPDQLQFPFPNKQGWIWILEKEKIPKTSQSTDKTLRQQKRKIEAFDVTPVKKHATIKDKSLMITEPDGTLTKVYLSGCIVEAVSAANLASRKWAKKYPVKVENKSSDIYHGSKLFYLYFETSCEKESWCKVLRLASCEDKEKLIWFYKSRAEFHNYLASLNVEYPSFLKPSTGINPEIGDRSVKVDGSSSKVRHFLKKLTKKTSKTAKEDKKSSENSVGGSSKLTQTEKKSNEGVEEKIIQAMIPKSVPSGSRNLGSQNSDTDSNDKMCRDDGTLCCNLLISRLFFDAKSSVDLRNLMQAHIQRMLSIARTPSFVGEIICTDVNPGVIPPYIHGMRVVPSDLKEVVAMELDIEYYGGAVLDIETRIEMQELENSDSKSVDDVTTDLLEGFEHYEEQIKLNEQTNQAVELKDDERHKLEETKSFKGNEQTASTSTLPKWKSVINSVAKQVSQVPLSLAIRVTTLRGTLKVYIKPPPSDQIWFGFTSMPDIDFSLESAVGDHKITSGHIALFIINKFKGAIRETMVLPNCESATVHFMLAEKNDWIPQQSAPFIWANPELNPEPPTEPTISHEVPCPQPPDEIHPQDVSSTTETTHNQTSSDDDEKPTENDEKTPLLESTEQNAAVVEENVGFPSSQPPSPPQAAVAEENKETADENKLKRSGTRAKMLGFRKKMGEKLEEKRRNIEEKGRHMVEKMRGPG